MQIYAVLFAAWRWWKQDRFLEYDSGPAIEYGLLALALFVLARGALIYLNSGRFLGTDLSALVKLRLKQHYRSQNAGLTFAELGSIGADAGLDLSTGSIDLEKPDAEPVTSGEDAKTPDPGRQSTTTAVGTRLREEIRALIRRGNTNLVVGMVFAASGLGLMFWSAFTATTVVSDEFTVSVNVLRLVLPAGSS